MSEVSLSLEDRVFDIQGVAARHPAVWGVRCSFLSREFGGLGFR